MRGVRGESDVRAGLVRTVVRLLLSRYTGWVAWGRHRRRLCLQRARCAESHSFARALQAKAKAKPTPAAAKFAKRLCPKIKAEARERQKKRNMAENPASSAPSASFVAARCVDPPGWPRRSEALAEAQAAFLEERAISHKPCFFQAQIQRIRSPTRKPDGPGPGPSSDLVQDMSSPPSKGVSVAEAIF